MNRPYALKQRSDFEVWQEDNYFVYNCGARVDERFGVLTNAIILVMTLGGV